MFPIVFKLSLVVLVFHKREQLSKPTFLAVRPVSLIPVSHVPNILTCSMSLVCHKVSLIVAIYKYYSSKAVLCAFMPISLVKCVAFGRNAVPKAISLSCCFAPLAFIPITVWHLSNCLKFAIMKLRERNRTVVEWW